MQLLDEIGRSYITKISYLMLRGRKFVFIDLSDVIFQDDIFTRLQAFPNVITIGHQAFFTKEALTNIAAVTLNNITAFELGTSDIFKLEFSS